MREGELHNNLAAYINTLRLTLRSNAIRSRRSPDAYVAIADQHVHLHDPQTFITKYVWSQDHKVIAIQYMVTAMPLARRDRACP